VDVLPPSCCSVLSKPLETKRKKAAGRAGTDRGFHGKTNGDETQMTTNSQHEQLPNLAILATTTLQAKLLSLRCRGGF
jgi:hypothetical protein